MVLELETIGKIFFERRRHEKFGSAGVKTAAAYLHPRGIWYIIE